MINYTIIKPSISVKAKWKTDEEVETLTTLNRWLQRNHNKQTSRITQHQTKDHQSIGRDREDTEQRSG